MRRALVLTRSWSDAPETATHGIFQRFSLFIDALDQHVDAIDILAFAPESADREDLAQRHARMYQRGRQARIQVLSVARRRDPSPWPLWSRYGRGVFSVDRQANYLNIAGPECVQAVAAALRKGPQLVLAHRLPTFTPLLPCWPHHPGLAVLFDMDDLEHRGLARALVHAPQWRSERLRFAHLPALLWRERVAVRASRHSFTCSTDDAQALQRLAGCARVTALPNAVAAPARLPARTANSQAVGFIGSFLHPPNVDAARWLLRDLWPRVLAQVPQARLRIAGAGSRQVLADGPLPPGVELLDYVHSLADFYGSVDLMVAPLRFGAGTRIKIIEAAGYGLVTVSTTVGAEGLVFRAGEDVAIADQAATLVQQVVDLLVHAERRLAMGAHARRSCEAHYSRQRAVNQIAAQVQAALLPG